MHTLEGRQYINGKLRGTVDVSILQDGRIFIKGHVFFCNMTVNSLNFPINVRTEKGENVEIVGICIEDKNFIQITVDDEEPIYCDPHVFEMEVEESLSSVTFA